ncbi:MAG: hypothetical protein ACXW5U_13475 [Thermoanaerobaculia bacterium]
MTRRTLVVAAVVALMMTASADAKDPARSREDALVLVERQHLELHEMFDRAPGVISDDENGITVSGFAVNVVVARIDSDGKVVTSCVDTEEAARRFLTAPADEIQAHQAKEH